MDLEFPRTILERTFEAYTLGMQCLAPAHFLEQYMEPQNSLELLLPGPEQAFFKPVLLRVTLMVL